MDSPRRHQAYGAFLAHRISGLVLGLFLPAHFYVLALALEGAQGLDRFLKFTELPLVRFGEWGLVVLLAIHAVLGLRLLVLEFLPWRTPTDDRTAWIRWGAAASILVGAVFALRAL